MRREYFRLYLISQLTKGGDVSISNQKKQQTKSGEFFWDWLKHEDNLFTNRSSLLLVAQSMLFASAATLIDKDRNMLSGFVALIGLLTSIVSLCVFERHIQFSKLLKDQVSRTNPARERFFRSIPNQGESGNHVLIGIVLPGLYGFAWVVWLVWCGVCGS